MERILNAAVDLFADKGFHGTRMEEIAQASGLPKANVYYYFSDQGEHLHGLDRAFDRGLGPRLRAYRERA